MNESNLDWRALLNLSFWMLLFVISLSISAAPRALETLAPLQYLHLIILYTAVIFTSRNFPITLLFFFGIAIDGILGLILGSSSLLLVLIVPYLQLLSRSALRFSILRIWTLFIGFMAFYQIGQWAIQQIFSTRDIDFTQLLLNSFCAIIIFPLVFTSALYIVNRFRPSTTALL